MQEIHFSEEDLANIQGIGQRLFAYDSSDPRSSHYNRVLVRPTIKWWRIILFVLAITAGPWCLYFLLVACSFPSQYIPLICIAGVLLTLVLCLKRILICLVRIYQRFAPASVRKKCRFEPSCSQYMILSLQKYGPIRGLVKGIARIKRCNPDNGGFDSP